MKKLFNKLAVLILMMGVVFSINMISADARIIKGYPNDPDREFIPRVEYEFTGPHMLYIYNVGVKRNILHQKIYDSDNNQLLLDKVFIPLDDILCEIRCKYYRVDHYEGYDEINLTVNQYDKQDGKVKWVDRHFDYGVFNRDDDIRSVMWFLTDSVKYQGKYYVDVVSLMLLTNSGNYCYYDDIIDACMFLSSGVTKWLLTTPEYRDVLMERYHKINDVGIPLDKFKANCTYSADYMFKFYLDYRYKQKDKNWEVLYQHRD